MAKINFNKLNLKVKEDIETLIFNEQEIEVKKYLPIGEKMEMIGDIINRCSEEEKFYNVGKLEVFFTIEAIVHYTNIKFTDKQREDVYKLYDLLVSSELKNKVFKLIPEEELEFIRYVINKTIKSVYKYTNSIYGLLDNISSDYSGLNLDVAELWKNLSERENVEFLEEVIQKLG
jgi:hypothetical protein